MRRHICAIVASATITFAGLTAIGVAARSDSALAAVSTGATTLPGPPAAAGGLIDATSCVAGPVCVSLGWNHHGNTSYTWVARSRDDTWTKIPTPPESDPSGPGPTAISCATKTWCMVTGSIGQRRAIAEYVKGTRWTVLKAPTVKGSLDFSIYKLSCLSPTWCVGVGSYVANKRNYLDATFLVAEVWNGSTWRMVPIDSPRTYAHQIDPGIVDGGAHPTASPQQVSCVSESFCVLAGFWQGVFVEEWNGHNWSKVAAPNAPTRPGFDSEFSSDTCASATFCVAVGGYAVSNAAWRPLIEQWNGRSWRIAALPRLPQYFNGKPGFNLDAVECSSANSCETFGDHTVANSGVNGLMWNGRSWRYVATGIRDKPRLVCLGQRQCAILG